MKAAQDRTTRSMRFKRSRATSRPNRTWSKRTSLPAAANGTMHQAGLRACEHSPNRLPMRYAQWLWGSARLAYRCGGSVGIADRASAYRTSRLSL